MMINHSMPRYYVRVYTQPLVLLLLNLVHYMIAKFIVVTEFFFFLKYCYFIDVKLSYDLCTLSFSFLDFVEY